MRKRIAIKIDALIERHFPERRVFLRSDSDTRFIRLRPTTQLFALLGISAFVAWSIIATAVLLMDSIGSGNFREQAKRDQLTYEARLNALADERDQRAAEALAAQERFNSALEQVSMMQSELLDSEIRRQELETGVEVTQSTLRRSMSERDAALKQASELNLALTSGTTANPSGETAEITATLDFLNDALSDTAQERDQIIADSKAALQQADEMAERIALMEDQNEQIFRQLEDAMTISVEPLDKMFSAAGLNTENLINTVRRGYTGQGGPLMPMSFSTRGDEPTADALRANGILNQMDRLNLYRIAAQKTPFALPVKHVRYDVRLDGQRFASGETPSNIAVPASGDTEFAISVDLDLLSTAPQLLSIVRDGVRAEIPYELRGELGVDIPFTPPVSYRSQGAIQLRSSTH